jgi:DNA-binding PadR family transcriptional regulator
MAENRNLLRTNAHRAICGIVYSMKPSRQWIEDRILLILDSTPCHGYDILRSLPSETKGVQLTTLYRWLHGMERDGLVESEIQSGPHGPDRRVYRLGPRGEIRLRRVLRDAIETVLHFYDAYRHSVTRRVYDELDISQFERAEGRVLFAAFPRLTQTDLALLRFVLKKNVNASIYVMGDTDIVNGAGIKYRHQEGTIEDIASQNDRFTEIWLSGVPDRQVLPRAIAECRRVLVPRGMLRITAPFVFFDEPKEPTLGEFIRVTAVQLFPDLGVVEGNDVGAVIESLFPDSGAFETFPGLVEFWARKS